MQTITYRKLNKVFSLSFSVIKFFIVKIINSIKRSVNITSKISPKEKLNLPDSLFKFPAKPLYKALE